MRGGGGGHRESCHGGGLGRCDRHGTGQRRASHGGRGAARPPLTASGLSGLAAFTDPALRADADGGTIRSVIAAPSRGRAVVTYPDLCALCEVCRDVCPSEAIAVHGAVDVDVTLCSGCGACVSACPRGVLEMVEV